MAHLTGNFTSEAPLSPVVREAISAAFEQGWADPKKRSQAASRAGILADQAKSEIASIFDTPVGSLEILGEPSMAHYLAISGFLDDKTTLVTSSIDLGKIRAVARAHKGPSIIIETGSTGILPLSEVRIDSESLISLQATNGETGVVQDLDQWRRSAARIVVDATRSLPTRNLIEGFSATTFDARSWNGPDGIGFIAISDSKNFTYPLPHIAPIRVPGSYSLPLLIGSAVAIHEFVEAHSHLTKLRKYLSQQLSHLSGIKVIASDDYASRYLSIIVDGYASEEVLTHLLKSDIGVDAGSACSPEDLTPSHVIAAMGYPTAGHIRFTLHPQHGEEDIHNLTAKLRQTIEDLSR